MHTFGMILVLVAGLLVVIDWLIGPGAPTARRQWVRPGLLHLAMVIMAIGVLCLFKWHFSSPVQLAR